MACIVEDKRRTSPGPVIPLPNVASGRNDGKNAVPGNWCERFERLLGLFGDFSWNKDSLPFYERMALTILECLDCDGANIRLLTAAQTDLVGIAPRTRAGSVPLIKEMPSVPVTMGRMPHLLETQEPILMDFSRRRPEDEYPDSLTGVLDMCAVTFPLVAGGSVLGVYDAIWNRRISWSADDIHFMGVLGRLFGVLVYYEKHASQMVELRVIEESRRLTSEIHDNLAQLVTTAKLEVEKAALSLERSDFDRLRNDLEDAEIACTQASDTIRVEMLSLRDAGLQTGHLVTSMQSIIRRMQKRYDVEIGLVLENVSERVIVAERMEFQVMRILQEALSNACKHSAADHIQVTLRADGAFLTVRVRDNGCGFDIGSVSDEHLGIRIMRERASLVGGTCSVISSAGAGTIVEVTILKVA